MAYYGTLAKQIETVPAECIPEIENYIGYVLYRYNQNPPKKETPDLSKYFGSVKMRSDALSMQKEMRDEWD